MLGAQLMNNSDFVDRLVCFCVEPRMEKTLDDVLAEIISGLETGANARKSPFHTPVIASLNADHRPEQRVMVLREFDSVQWTLRFHTDARSPKVAQMHGGAASALFYDASEKVQIRVSGTAEVHGEGPMAEAAWQESTTFARRCYMAETAPSSHSDAATSGLPDWIEGLQPTEEQIAPGRENFAVLLIKIEALDWLYLANSGHRRAQFTIKAGEGATASNWLVP